jgi:hypothetical protein
MERRELHELLMSLPEAEEYEHGGHPAFRIRGRPRFATMLDDEGVNLFPDEPGILAFTQAHPEVCTERWWGKRLAAVRVAYRRAKRELVEEIVLESYAARAPKRLIEQVERERRGGADER